MKMRKLFAGLAAAATLLGGLALGAGTAVAQDVTVPNGAAWPTAEGEYPSVGRTLTIKAETKEQLENRTFQVSKLADYVYYQDANAVADPNNPVKGSVGLQTSGWGDANSGVPAAVQKAMAAATADNTDLNDQYAPTKDANGNPVYRSDDPLAWAAQAELKTGDNPTKSNGRLDQSPLSPWGGDTGLTRKFAEALELTNVQGLQTQTVDANTAPIQEHTNDAGETDYYYVTVNNVDPGLYVVLDARTQANAQLNSSYTFSLRMVVGTKLQLNADADSVLSNGEINLKNQNLPIHKQVVKGDATNGYTPNETPDYNVGDEVTYELSTTIPVYTGYDKNPEEPYNPSQGARTLNVLDTMSQGLTFKSVESVKLYDGNTEVATLKEATDSQPNDYQVDISYPGTYGKSNSTVEHDQVIVQGSQSSWDAIVAGKATSANIRLGGYVNEAAGSTSAASADGILSGKTVKIILKATLNKDALISTPDSAQANPNKVELLFSNNPENNYNMSRIPGGEVNVYTFKFQLEKYAKDAGKDVKLNGAKFKIAQGDTNQDFLKKEITRVGDNYTVTWTKTTEDQATEFVSGDYNEDGTVSESEAQNADYVGKIFGLDGLKTGTYTVKETQAPEGYQNTVLPSFSFTITANYKRDDATNPNAGAANEADKAWGDDYLSYKDNESDQQPTVHVNYSAESDDVWNLVDKDGTTTFQFNVKNVKNVTELPLTGAAGIAMFTVAGLLLAGAAALVFAKSRATKRALHA